MPPIVPLAFSFLHLPMLGWLAAAAVPVVIHLWHRRRHREVPWAAMQYLLAAMRQSRRRLLLEQWSLLALRVLIVALVVLAVAQPYLEHRVFALAAGLRTHRVLVVDGSFSMAYRPGEKRRFDQAKEWAARIVEQSPKGDGFTLVLMGSPPRVAVGTPSFESGELLREIEGLQVAGTKVDLSATLSVVQRAVQTARHVFPRLTRHEVIFITDLGRVGWAPPPGSAAAAQIRRSAGQLAEMANLTVLDVGQPDAENVAVVALDAVEPVVTVGQQVHVRAQVRSFGLSRSNRTMELLVDGRHVSQQAVDVAAGATMSVGFSYRFDTPGDHAVEVRLDADRLDVDDHRWLAVTVKQAITVLCIDGRPSGEPFGGAADYLAHALSPDPDRHEGLPVHTEVAPESALLERDFGRYDVVFLCNVAQFTSSEAHVLDAYLAAGGNLVFFLGDRVLSDRYNRELTGQLPGTPRVLPVRLGTTAPEGSYHVDALAYRHPAIQAFRGREKAGLLTTPVSRYCRLQWEPNPRTAGDATQPSGVDRRLVGREEPAQVGVPTVPQSQVVLALTNGDPLIVEAPIRRGRSVVVATSADLSWTAAPLWPSFVPIVQELTAYCVGRQVRTQNAQVGEPIEGAVPVALAGATASVQRPDGGVDPLRLEAEGDFGHWRYAETGAPGIYAVRVGSAAQSVRLFAVNLDPAESDLTPLSVDELRNDVWAGVPFQHKTAWQSADHQAATVSGNRGALPVALLYGVLGFVLLETFVAWRAGHHPS